MVPERIHRFELKGQRFAIDTETCFCFECDAISWDVLELYPETPINRIFHLLKEKHDLKELEEVVGELEWLRATKSILPAFNAEVQQKLFEMERGVKQLSLTLPREAPKPATAKRGWLGRTATGETDTRRELARDAVTLLLSRSQTQTELELEFVEEKELRSPELIADLCVFGLKAAQLAGKKLKACVVVTDVELSKQPASLAGHTISAKLEFEDVSEVAGRLKAFAKARPDTLGRLVKALAPGKAGIMGRIVVRPNHPAFGEVVRELDEVGFGVIELDLEGAYVANPGLDPQAMLEGLSQSATYYAERLLKHHYFRVDPIASLFWRIYNGAPLRRADPAGTNALAVDATGDIYPSQGLQGLEGLRLGSLAEGKLDEEKLKACEDIGSVTTGECMRCWARNLCGGGSAAVHQALSGAFRQPNEAWCDAQRSYMGSAVSAFDLLSAEGVNFTRVYSSLDVTAKPSLFTAARAAFRMNMGMRPLEEADAEMLKEWENWNRAAYFLGSEQGIFLGNQYEREMDALHPNPLQFEVLLLRKTGEPLGLLRVRPDPATGLADGYLYFHDPADYDSDSLRKSFRAILKEAGGQQDIKRLMTPAAPWEEGLQRFLEAVGFRREGVLREALYTRSAYHDLTIYGITTDEL